MDHLPDEVVARIGSGVVAPTHAEAEHLQACEECSAVVSSLLRMARTSLSEVQQQTALGTPTSVVEGRAPSPALFGRYRLIRVLGEGAMGRVYEAHDPRLGRPVALKLLRGSANSETRTRLLREAQGAARVRHPNVVTIYDVGLVKDELFIAMELVPGGTLRQWARRSPRAWPEVLRAFVKTGRGLAAVHDAGLVHRDFKPDNVLLEENGTPRVSDFGLVGERDAQEPSAELDAPFDFSTATLTQTGALLGTPAYMAPEVLAGQPATAASDQFSFCVALYEALAGGLPFVSRTLAELRQQVMTGARLPTPSGTPRALMQVIRRGLSPEPARRFASIPALLAALEAIPRRRRALVTMVVLASVAAVLVGGVARLSGAAPCPEVTVGAAWDAPRRTAVEIALVGGKAPPALVKLVLADLDTYARAWARASVEACRETRVSGDQSELQYAQRSACLDQRRRELAAVTALLSQGDLEVTRRAASMSSGLAALDICSDPLALKSETLAPENPELKAQVLAAREDLAQVFALGEASKTGEALALASKVDERVTRLGYQPLLAETRMRHGQLLNHLEDYPGSVPLLREAVSLAVSTGQDRLAAKSLALLAESRSFIDRGGADLDALVDLARALTARAGTPDRTHEDVEFSVGYVRTQQGRLKEAQTAFEASLVMAQKLYGPRHPRVAAGWVSVADTRAALGDQEGALHDFQQAEELLLATVGKLHRSYIVVTNNKALLLASIGRAHQALEAFRESLELSEQFEGPQSRRVARGRLNIAGPLVALGQVGEAVSQARAGHTLWLQLSGTDLDDLNWADHELARALAADGQFEEAEQLVGRALKRADRPGGPKEEAAMLSQALGEILLAEGKVEAALPRLERAATLGAGLPLRASSAQGALARVLVRSGRWGEAEAHARKGLEALGENQGPPDLAIGLRNALAESQLRQGRAREALTTAQAALVQCEKLEGPGAELFAGAEFALAQAQWELGRRDEAKELANGARQRLVGLGRAGNAERDRVAAWLARAR